MAEIEIEKLMEKIFGDEKWEKQIRFSTVSPYPPVMRDLSIVVDEKIQNKDVEDLIITSGNNLIENLELYDIFRSEKIGMGKKSMTYKIVFRSIQKTLTGEEVNEIMNNIVTNLQEKLFATLRS